jgi:hypothetical protein
MATAPTYIVGPVLDAGALLLEIGALLLETGALLLERGAATPEDLLALCAPHAVNAITSRPASDGPARFVAQWRVRGLIVESGIIAASRSVAHV